MDDQEMGAAPYQHQQVTTESGEAEAPPSYPVVDDNDHAYPVVDGGGGGGAYPADLAYPVDDAYPADEAYPVDDACPTDADVAYPVTNAYPAGDEQLPYPVTDAIIEQPAKKKIKVDKEVVDMLPSHLRKRKTVAKQAAAPVPARKLALPPPDDAVAAAVAASSTNQPTGQEQQSDDVNAFLKEIDEL
jgi:hypothetical protein